MCTSTPEGAASLEIQYLSQSAIYLGLRNQYINSECANEAGRANQ